MRPQALNSLFRTADSNVGHCRLEQRDHCVVHRRVATFERSYIAPRRGIYRLRLVRASPKDPTHVPPTDSLLPMVALLEAKRSFRLVRTIEA